MVISLRFQACGIVPGETGQTHTLGIGTFTAATGQLLNACFFIFTGQVANAPVAAVISLFVLPLRNRAN